MAEPASRAQFKLSTTLAGHGADVRALVASPQSILFSSSRDATARSWVHSSKGWEEGFTFTGQHDGFVNSVEFFTQDAQPYLATAGQDKLIHIWPLPATHSSSSSPPTPTHTLIGHEGNVCTLHASKDSQVLVSGSWDKTAKVWSTSDFQLAYTLKGHDQAVWAVLALEGGEQLVLTGAADNLIKLWRGSKEERTFKGHSQAVRALAKLDSSVGDGSLFASAGNDGSIRLWSLATGDAVHVLNGHDSFVYSLSPIPASAGGGLVSGGEDRTMRVWRAADGECEQTIVVPAVSVWTVLCLPDGDIACGASDGLIRIFTRDASRLASAAELKSFEEQVSKTTLNPSQVGDVKKSDLPGPEALAADGKKEGQVIMVKTASGTVEAHQWSSATRSWTKVGEVVDAVGSTRKQLHNGEEYDYVFDVDIGEGLPPLKLPYNVNQNPYEAAQNFLYRYELPISYIDQVVKHIEANSGGVALGTGASNEYVDPYTGASRYTGGGVPTGPRPTVQTQPRSNPSPASTAYAGFTGFNADPYTGGGGRSAGVSATPKLLPHKSFLNFTQANLAPLRAKVGQLNEQLAADPSTSSLSLTSEEISLLDSLVAYLVIATSPGAKAPPLGEAEGNVVQKLLQWPVSQQFPGLDLIRLITLSSPLPESIPSLLEIAQSTSGTPKEVETNTMLAFRALSNLFTSKSGQTLAVEEAVEIVDTLKRRGMVGINKNGKVALATIALNYSVVAVQKSLGGGEGSLLFEFVAELLRDGDAEVVYRSLIALGNLLLSPQITEDIPAAALQRYKTLAKDAAKRVPEARVKAVVAEIEKGRL
ncbi:PFU-domain-containing protein [Meredithblackwellia eburnea MCA 4105]